MQPPLSSSVENVVMGREFCTLGLDVLRKLRLYPGRKIRGGGGGDDVHLSAAKKTNEAEKKEQKIRYRSAVAIRIIALLLLVCVQLPSC